MEGIWEELKIYGWKLQMGRGTDSKQVCFSIGRFANFDKLSEAWFIPFKNMEVEENVVFPILNLFTVNGSLKYLIYLCFEKET